MLTDHRIKIDNVDLPFFPPICLPWKERLISRPAGCTKCMPRPSRALALAPIKEIMGQGQQQSYPDDNQSSTPRAILRRSLPAGEQAFSSVLTDFTDATYRTPRGQLTHCYGVRPFERGAELVWLTWGALSKWKLEHVKGRGSYDEDNTLFVGLLSISFTSYQKNYTQYKCSCIQNS